MNQVLRILMVEDTVTDAVLAERELRRAGLSVAVRRVDREDVYRRELEEFLPQAILSDFSMPHFDGMTALQIAREAAPDVPFIFVSGTLGEDYAIRALRNGATDYVLKSNLVRLPPVVERAVIEAKARAERRRSEQLQALEHTVVRHIAAADSMSAGITGVLAAICESEGWDVGRHFRLDEKAGLLRFETAWCVPRLPLEKIIERSRETAFACGEGLVGRSWESGAPSWSADISTDPRVRDAHLARHFEVRGAFVLPVTSGGSVIGAMGFLSRGIREPDDRLLQASRLIGNHVGLFLARQEEQRHIARLNRIYAVLSGINSTIVRVRDRDALFREACRIAVEAGGFREVWIGIVDAQAGRIQPLAWEGVDPDYVFAMPLGLKADGGAPIGLSGRAVLERRPMVADDMAADQSIALRAQARERGFHSLAMLPLVVGGSVVGVLALYTETPGFFRDEGEMRLLAELAGDIAFALEHIENSEKLHYLAYYDSLTGLPNATLFHERLARYIDAARAAGEKLVVGTLDIDRFKTINDSLGRQAGDELLREIATRLCACIRPVDGLARIGADQFAFVQQGANPAEELARHCETRYGEVFEEPIELGATVLRASAKIGFATFPDDGQDAETVYKHAEAALRKARERNERYLFYAEHMTARIAEKLALENELRRAIKEEQFVLHYQPKVEATTRRVVGVEALIRWQHPKRGLVPPLEFIPLLEETGLILEVGAWALAQAARDHQNWLSHGLPAPHVAVNVSAIQLRRPDFVPTVEKAIRLGATPHGLDIEITESLLMEEVAANIEKLKVLRELGIGAAIDDFGTGYSSLGYLAKLPVESLKIDRSFVVKMTKEPDIMTLVSTMISLGHALRLKVVAEGVDSEEQANVLRLLRCDEMQGYLFSRPIPFDELAALLKKG